MISQIPSVMIALMIDFYSIHRDTIAIVKDVRDASVHFLEPCHDSDMTFYNMRRVISEIKMRNYDFISDETKLIEAEFYNLIEHLAEARMECIIQEAEILKRIMEVKIAASVRPISDYEFGKYNHDLDNLRCKMRQYRAEIDYRDAKHKCEVEKRYGNFEKYLERPEIDHTRDYWNNYIIKKVLM